MKVSMGGRVAEEIVLNEISTGASQDIQQASRIVRAMIMQYGMSNVLGPVAYGGDPAQQYYFGQPQKNYSEEVASEIDKEVHKYMDEAYEACRTIINDNRDKLEAIAKALIDKETLSAEELKAIVFGEEKTEFEKPFIKEPPSVTVELTKAEEVEQPKVPDSSTPTPV